MRNIPFGRPILGNEEKDAVMEVLGGHALAHGPKVKEFESVFADFTGANYAVSVSSCTAAMHLYYFYLGIGAGDEVIVAAQTHTATGHAVELAGAKPVFVDAVKSTGNIDTDLIEAKITEKTKAIAIVHFLGMPADMEKICAIAKKHNLPVLEDCALAIGSYVKGTHAGLLGDVGCFSFYPVKHITTGEGGMLITKHKEVAEKILRQKAFGVDRNVGERKVPGVYDVTMLGFNYRLNEIQASIGVHQVKRISGFLAKRKENYEVLEKGLKNISEITLFESTNGDFTSSYYCLSVMLNESLMSKREALIKNLNSHGVGTSIYYPKPVPLMSYYALKYGYKSSDFPVASYISDSTIALPVGPHLNSEDMKYIVTSFKNAIKEEK